MRNQTKYLFIYLFVLCLLVGSVVQLAQAQDTANSQMPEIIELDQAQLDQMLAPIALYPDTLLSHILVASTYPLEVIQAARWRVANADLDEQQALNAVENKDWDPSVQALVPFSDLLQKLSEDLDWLQSLGSAFLVNEQQILTSVQNLRQKAYDQGNLTSNDYVNIEQEQGEIVIQTVRKEVVYVPYYDTRVVYGNWWWHNQQPYYWHRPRHSILSAGLYWSAGFNIRPRFYFGGFNWRNRYVVANHHYRRHANRHWSNGHNQRQVVRVKEYPRWSHNPQHRRGAQHRVNGQRIVRNIHRGYSANSGNKSRYNHQIDKKRGLNLNNYTKKHSKNAAKKYHKSHAKRFKQALGNQPRIARQTKALETNYKTENKTKHQTQKQLNNKQRVVNQSKHPQRQKLSNDHRPNKATQFDSKQKNNRGSQKHASRDTQSNHTQHSTAKTQNKIRIYKTSTYKPSDRNSSAHFHSNKQQKSRTMKVARQSNHKKTHR